MGLVTLLHPALVQLGLTIECQANGCLAMTGMRCLTRWQLIVSPDLGTYGPPMRHTEVGLPICSIPKPWLAKMNGESGHGVNIWRPSLTRSQNTWPSTAEMSKTCTGRHVVNSEAKRCPM